MVHAQVDMMQRQDFRALPSNLPKDQEIKKGSYRSFLKSII